MATEFEREYLDGQVVSLLEELSLTIGHVPANCELYKTATEGVLLDHLLDLLDADAVEDKKCWRSDGRAA